MHALTVNYASRKNCFVSFPSSVVKGLDPTKVHVYEVTGDAVTGYVSWTGDVNSSYDGLQISGLFASKIGYSDEEEVSVQLVSSVQPCRRIYVEPVSVNDWEILEMHAAYVESHLLDQLRVVWPGMVFPCWVQKSICIFCKISTMEPDGKCSLLEQQTELIISPKVRSGGQRSGQLSSSSQRSVEPTVSSKPNDKPDQDKTDPENKKQTKPKKDRTISENVDDDLHEESNMAENLSHDPLRDGSHSPLQEPGIMGSVYRALHTVQGWIFGEHATHQSLVNVESSSTPPRELYDKDLALSSRVQPMDKIFSKPKSEKTTGNLQTHPILIKEQPCNVYVTYETLRHSLPAVHCLGVPSTFLAALSHIKSPVEKDEQVKQTMNKRTRRDRNLNTSRNEEEPIENDPLQSDSSQGLKMFVRVIVLGNHQQRGQRDTADQSEKRTELPNDNHVLPGHVILHDLLRRQANQSASSKVRIEAIQQKDLIPEEIQLHPVGDMPSHITPEMLQIAANHWISSVSDISCPLVVNQGTLVSFPVMPDVQQDIYLTFKSKEGEVKQGQGYCLLYPQMITKVKFKVAKYQDRLSESFPKLSDLSPARPKFKLEELGGVKNVASRLIEHLETCLCQRPLVRSLCTSAPGLSHGGIVLCGSRGSGKSALANAVLHHMTQWPNLASHSVIECRGLRGKRIENIEKVFNTVFKEATWRQPSVILLEDLDVIAAAPSGPEQELSGEAIYYQRVAEVLRHILKEAVKERSKLGVLVTCVNKTSLHKSLVAPRGTHLFQEVIQIEPPNENQRKEILDALLLGKTTISPQTQESVDLLSVARRTEGYVARDLESILDRAIHAHHIKHCLSNTKGHQEEIVLTTEDFDKALEGFTPSSLQNVPLHTAGETGWQDLGGLHSVKNTIIETLQWPSKYPKLFANCPLRLRSGLLLYGAPGTGKTLLAGIVAKECGLNFISIKGPELLSKYIGASEQAVRDTFLRAQSAKPCILFFDEFDSLAPRRGHDSTGVTDRVVNQLLTQLDGVEGLEGVSVLAATSRPDLIDPALLRPGRLDKALYCNMPNQDERLEILKSQTRLMNLSADVDLEELAEKCVNFTGADFKALLYNAQLASIHETSGHVMVKDTVSEPSSSSASSMPTTPRLQADWTFVNGEDGNRSPPKDKSPAAKDDQEQSPKPASQDDVDVAALEAVAMVTEKPIPKKILGHMPSLHEGYVELDAVQEKDLYDSLMPFLQGREPDTLNESKNTSHTSIQITREHLLQALAEMTPSVSEIERLKYRNIYETFVSSRGGKFSDLEDTVGKKATLA